ncbi:MAG: hypothetical protein LBJ13_02980 [Puniceicoccales bacterium]|jgi:hypothetical protein|nr:hypothetical protein [Puniceicoccales bacterium]
MEMQNQCCEVFAKWLKNDNLSLILTEFDRGSLGNIFVFKSKYGGVAIRPLYFCPWCGKELNQAFLLNLRGKLDDFGVERACWDDFDFEKEIPGHLKKYFESRMWWDENICIHQRQHKAKKRRCDALDYEIYEGDDPVIYWPHIRTYGLLKKKKCALKQFRFNFDYNNDRRKYDGFVPLDYCYFCGAKLPKRLDEELSKILQRECGLESWKDYKKAPKEFHSDEWWRGTSYDRID